MESGYSIGEVAERTGLSVAVLRAWESRFGFPTPRRTDGGRRVYDEREIELLRGVERDRGAGLSLRAAIGRAQSSTPAPERSLFAAIRARRPELAPQLLTTRMMLGLSRAIEDELLARSERAAWFGSFQQVAPYREAQPRWREISRTAEFAAVFADFRRRAEPRGGPLEVPIADGHPLAREWAIVCDGPSFGVCLSAWERAGARSRSRRRFEAIWTVEPEIVRAAARSSARLVVEADPQSAGRLPERLEEPVGRDGRDLGALVSLTNRMVAYAHRRALRD